MKRIIFSILTLLLITGSSLCQKKIDIEAEKESIKKVVQAALDAIKAKDYDAEVATWVHSPYIERRGIVGWDSVSVFYQKRFKQWNDEPESLQVRVLTASNFDIYINGNFASVFHDEHFEGIFEGEEGTNDGRVHKYLEKIEGEWKVITLF
jgi:ketosteroid isomerase-like protein